jgi:hypothetical protein
MADEPLGRRREWLMSRSGEEENGWMSRSGEEEDG